MTAITASVTTKATAFGQLAKVRLFHIWLGPVLAWSLVPAGLAGQGRTVALVVLFTIVVMTGMWATHALDDLTGFRDGSDIVNYAPERNRSQRKPLVLGTLSERQALGFAVVAAGTAVAAVLAFAAVASFQPRWILLVALAAVLLGVQYSVGIRFSYRFPGGGELLTAAALGATVVVPFAGATGQLTLLATLEAAAFGIWLVQVLICSNAADAEADREVDRHTVAADTTVVGNRRFITAVFTSSAALIVIAVASGRLTPWAIVLMAPAWALQAYVLVNARAGRYRLRRNFGFDAVLLGVVGLALANVIS